MDGFCVLVYFFHFWMYMSHVYSEYLKVVFIFCEARREALLIPKFRGRVLNVSLYFIVCFPLTYIEMKCMETLGAFVALIIQGK